MKCLIVDDEEMAVKVIENHIKQINGLEIAGIHYNAMDAFAALQKEKVELLFLDIQMPKMSGVNLLQSLPNPPHVIFTTAHREFALDGYNLDVVDYLLKPIAFVRFLKAVSKVFRLEQNAEPVVPHEINTPLQEPAFFYIKCDRQYIKILLQEVIYIESLRNHIKIITESGSYITLLGISQIEEKLPPQHFLRIHRSFIVSLSKIKQFSTSQVTINDQEIPIGNLYRKEVMRRLSADMI